MARNRRAFTLVEAIVVIAILTILFALIVPAVQMVRASADRLACQAQMRQIGIALQHYAGDHGHLPPGRRGKISESEQALSWMVLLCPYLEESAVLREAEAACRSNPIPSFNPPHRGLAAVPAFFTCPTDGRLRAPLIDVDGNRVGCASYLGVSGSGRHAASGLLRDGLFGADNLPGQAGYKLTYCPDGLSNTLLVGERPPPDNALAGQWYARVWHSTSVFTPMRGPDHTMYAVEMARYPDACPGPFSYAPGRTSNPCDRYHFWSLHPRGANFLFGDGSCRFLAYSARDLLPALASRDGGEAVTVEEP